MKRLRFVCAACHAVLYLPTFGRCTRCGCEELLAPAATLRALGLLDETEEAR